MGVLKDLYESILKELGVGQGLSSASGSAVTDKEGRANARRLVGNHLFDLECTLLLNSQQKGAMFLSHEEDDAQFDELELIVRNNVSVKKHIGTVKECILDLDEISTTDDEKETKELHRDELSQDVLNILQKQMTQVHILNDEEDNEDAKWFEKRPKEFVRGALIDGNRKENAFSDVRFNQDLSSVDMDCQKYLRNNHSNSTWNSVRSEDEVFNKDALKLLKEINNWTEKLKTATGKERDSLIRKKEKAENVLAKATNARNSALQDAFRTGDISEYYYRHRTDQLEKREYTRVPEMFEVDALKNREQYLKNHDLQDLSKDESDAIFAVALKRAEREKEIYLKKKYLTKKGLSRSRRYLIAEMAINKDIFYRGLASDGGYRNTALEDEETNRISVDLDEQAEDYIGMTMKQVPTAEQKARSLKK